MTSLPFWNVGIHWMGCFSSQGIVGQWRTGVDHPRGVQSTSSVVTFSGNSSELHKWETEPWWMDIESEWSPWGSPRRKFSKRESHIRKLILSTYRVRWQICRKTVPQTFYLAEFRERKTFQVTSHCEYFLFISSLTTNINVFVTTL